MAESEVSDLHEMVKTKVEGFDENAEGDADMEFTGDSIPWSRLFTPFASCGDYLLLLLACFFSLAMGASLPGISFLFGGSVDDMSSGSDAAVETMLLPAIAKWIEAGYKNGEYGSYDEASWAQLEVDGSIAPGEDGYNADKLIELTAAYEVIALYITPDMTDLKKTASMMFFIGFAVFVVAGGMMTFWGLFGESIAFKVRIHYFRKCLEKDAAFYDVNVPTAMSSKISKETAAIQRGLSDKIATFIYGLATFFLGLGFSFFYGWLFTCILLVSIPVMAVVGVLIGTVMESGMVEAMKAYSQSAGYAEQALNAIRVVHTYGQEVLELENYSKFLSRAREAQGKQTFRTAVASSLIYLTIYGFYGYSLWFGGVLRWNEVKWREVCEDIEFDGVSEEVCADKPYSSGPILSVMFSTVFGAMMLGTSAPGYKAIVEGKCAGKLVQDTMNHKPVIDPTKGGKKISPNELKGHIEFKNVDFTYPTRKELKVLKSFSCTFEAGKTTALVGPSGSGKSTIIQLVERFYAQDSGSVTVDGTAIEDYDIRSLRRAIGYIGQEAVLFNTTVRENLKMSKPDATEAEMIEALKAASAYDFVMRLPDQLDNMVGGGGGQLSGGQKQRVAIARAFLKKPKVLLLDEATSALDKVNEKAVQDAIDRYRKAQGGITVIAIAHRLSTIRDSDKIVVLKDGVLTEMGNHEELLKNYPEGIYHGFVKKQESAEAETGPGAKKSIKAVVRAETINKKAATLIEDDMEIEEEFDPEEKEKLKSMLEKDKVEAEKDKEFEQSIKEGAFSRLLPYNTPFYFIYIAIFFNILDGAASPLFGVIFSKILDILALEIDFGGERSNPAALPVEDVKSRTAILCALCGVLGFVMFLSNAIAKFLFGTVGENVTLSIRKALYKSILEKNVGFFDFRENGASVLTSAMAEDTSIINGVSTESLGPALDGMFAMLVGIGIGFAYSWKLSLICLGLAPLMVLGSVMEMQATQGGVQDEEGQKSIKEANLLCGDAIVNYKTVQSFGHEELIVDLYEKLLLPIKAQSTFTHIMSGVGYGFSQLTQFGIFAGLFYFGGLFIERDYPDLKPEAVFIAMFAIMFGASQAGQVAAMGPDAGKAEKAAQSVFRVIEKESLINAMEMDAGNKGIRISPHDIKGKVEFRNVWFRYPTRKEEFVLRGLNLEIEPGESVALVGESGCGKSTFINMLMRFYDPEFGEVLLDDINIKEYNLHDLRKAISLVMQEPIVFNYSILENVLYGKTDASNTEVQAACEQANCMEFINKADFSAQKDDSAEGLMKEMKLNQPAIIALIGQGKFDEEMAVLEKCKAQEERKGSFVAHEGDVDQRPGELKDIELSKGFWITAGIRGGKLSGGQKQRVAIARTIIRKPKVLMLDEATSALDEDAQKKVQAALNEAMKGRTVIIIAHRMSTIEGCDKIFVLEYGKVAEEGTMAKLKSQGGHFAKMEAKSK